MLNVRILIQMIYPVSIEQQGAALEAAHFIACAQQIFRKIGAVLTGHAGDQGNFSHYSGTTMVLYTAKDPSEKHAFTGIARLEWPRILSDLVFRGKKSRYRFLAGRGA